MVPGLFERQFYSEARRGSIVVIGAPPALPIERRWDAASTVSSGRADPFEEDIVKRVLLAFCLLLLPLTAVAQNCIPNPADGLTCSNGVSTRANPAGGYDSSTGLSSRPNPLGGQDYSNGVSSRPNPSGGMTYSNGLSSRPNPSGGVSFSNGLNCIPNPSGGLSCQ